VKLTTVALDDIHPDPDNIRDAAQDADISSLAADIAQRGLLQPLIIYPHPDLPGQYKISGGHRRYHALRRIGLETTDANIIDAPAGDLDRVDLMYAENEHRRSLNPIEVAKVYKRYADAGLTQVEISRRVKRAQSQVSQYLHLLTLPRDVQRRLEDGQITVGHASKLVRQDRIDRGEARLDTGGSHQTSVAVPHFNSAHPLYHVAASRCRNEGHDPALRIGGACGPCWEYKIRADAGYVERTTVAPTTLKTFGDPREVLAQLACRRCGISALDRPAERRCTYIRDGKRLFSDAHEFPYVAVEAVA
jgi:ParB family chromosome partitioning protein